MRRLVLVLIIGFMIACSFGQKTPERQEIAITEPPPGYLQTIAAQAIQTQIGPVQATAFFTHATDIPLAASFTPAATATPIPSLEYTQTPLPLDPIVIEGSGSNVLDLPAAYIGKVYFLDIEETSDSNFIVYPYNESGEKTDLLINTIGNYKGRHFVFPQHGSPRRYEITCSGNWRFTFLPFTAQNMHFATVASIYNGEGDDVVTIDKSADTGIFSTAEETNFIVYTGRILFTDLLINEIGPYHAKKIIPKDTDYLVINTEGPWTLELEE